MKHRDPIERVPDQIEQQRGVVGLLAEVNGWFTRHFHELTVLNRCPIPTTGPAILVSNHTAGIDPLLLQSACPRLIVWMMAREYYDLWPLRHIFGAVGMIPVDRDGRDMSATRAALRALRDGRVLGIFPEGRWSPDGELLPFQPGVAMLAAKGQAPIFPAYLEGTMSGRDMVGSVLRPCTATAAFGSQVAVNQEDTSREGLEQAAQAIREAVERLKARVRGGV